MLWADNYIPTVSNTKYLVISKITAQVTDRPLIYIYIYIYICVWLIFTHNMAGRIQLHNLMSIRDSTDNWSTGSQCVRNLYGAASRGEYFSRQNLHKPAIVSQCIPQQNCGLDSLATCVETVYGVYLDWLSRWNIHIQLWLPLLLKIPQICLIYTTMTPYAE